jgi:hypothetical protein
MGTGHSIIVCLCLHASLASGIAAAPSAAPDGPEASNPPAATPLLERLETLVRSLREERQAYYGKQASLNTALEEARSAIRHWDTELEILAQQEERLQAETADLRQRLAADRETLSRQTQAEHIIDRRLQEFARTQADQLGRDPVPLQTAERRAAPAALGETPDPHHPLTTPERLRLIWQHIEQELSWTQSAQSMTVRMPRDDGTQPFVRLLRIGHTVLGYVTEDGRDGAWWDGKGSWRRANPGEIDTLRESLAILDGQRVPALQLLPVPPITPEDRP